MGQLLDALERGLLGAQGRGEEEGEEEGFQRGEARQVGSLPSLKELTVLYSE